MCIMSCVVLMLAYHVALTPFLLKTAAEHIFVPLSMSHLFNQSLQMGTLPFNWVSANIVPIHKRNDKHIPGNYRPISLTSIVIKVFERILFRHLVINEVSSDWVDVISGVPQG